MTAAYLSKVGNDLVNRCGTRDPFRIAHELGIEVLFCEDFGPLKGMYRVIKRNRFIFINKDLSPRMQTIVCAHEIGHDQLHRNMAKNDAIQEFMLYDMATKPEYEANIVAAEILLDTDTVGKNEFSADSKFPYDLPITVKYHAVKLITLPVSSNMAKGMDYNEVLDLFEEAGFVNIKIEAKYDIITGWFTDDGEVEKVTVNGNKKFFESDQYRPDAEIVITYHTFKKNKK